MQKMTVSSTLMLSLFLSLAMVGLTHAQQVDALITPMEARLGLGESTTFEAFAFQLDDAGRAPARIDSITWSVRPDSIGSITEDGFFMAGRKSGIAEVQAIIVVGDQRLKKAAKVVIGLLQLPFFDVKVVPAHAVVPMGSEKQFTVVAQTRGGREAKIRAVRWEFQPRDLGKIDNTGLFSAGDNGGHGKVIAVVEIDDLRIVVTASCVVSAPDSSSISGNISADADNLPIPGAVVRAIRLGRIPWTKRAQIDDRGNYTVENLIPGIYVLTANARGFIAEFYDDARNYLGASPVAVGESDDITGIDFGLSAGVTIAGAVLTDPENEPLPHAHVVARLVVNRRFAYYGRTDDHGSYEIDALPSGTYSVQANARGYNAEYYDNAASLGEATLLEVRESETVTGIDFALGKGSALAGQVTDAKTGLPIKGALVQLFGADRATVHHHWTLHETRTNDEGEYLIQIRPGSYLAFATAPGYTGEFFEDGRDRGDATPVTVAADSHSTGIDFDLVRRSSISGTVSDAGGDALTGAVVEAFPENRRLDSAASDAGFRAKTDSNGQYTIENVPSGVYLVVANAREYLPEFWQEAASKRAATPVAVADSTDVTGIDFTLEFGGSIAGIVCSDVDSLPLPKASVVVYHSNSGRHVRTHTDENGAYSVSGLPSGDYLVQAIARDFSPEFYDNARNRRDATGVPVTAPDNTPNIDIYLAPQADKDGTIAGKVYADADSSSILGAVIIAVSRNNRRPHITFTGPEGHYRLTDLGRGKYYVFAWAFGFTGEFYHDARVFQNAQPVVVESGQVSGDISFGLAARSRRGPYAVRGQVRSAEDNEPLEGVVIHARTGDTVEANGVTDAEGNYVLTDLPAGEYQLEATGVGLNTGYFGANSFENSNVLELGDGKDAEDINLALSADGVTSVESGQNLATLPDQFALHQNYPNPFNPETIIKYNLAEPAKITLKIFNIIGQEILTLVDEHKVAGVHSVQWTGLDKFDKPVASGVYIFQIVSGETFKMSKRMLLLK